MIEVEMTKDIRDFEPHFLLGMTKRQIIFIVIACAYGVPFMVFAPFQTIQNRLFVGIMVMLPVIVCGFVKWEGMKMEILLVKLIYRMITPQKRKMTQKNEWQVILEDLRRKERIEAYNQMSKREQKKAAKAQKKGVKYSKNPELKGYR